MLHSKHHQLNDIAAIVMSVYIISVVLYVMLWHKMNWIKSDEVTYVGTY